MRRRELIGLVGGAAAAWPLWARAQQSVMPVIGLLTNVPSSSLAPHIIPAFRKGLNEAGFVEGRNVIFDYRWSANKDNLPALATEMVQRKVAVIFAQPLIAALTAKAATSTIPIVFVIGYDPVEAGLVASLNRPGGNITGLTTLSNSLARKQLEMLRELVPNSITIAFLINPDSPTSGPDARDMQTTALALGQKLIVVRARNESEIDTAVTAAVEQGAGALIVGSDLFLATRRMQLVALSAQHRLPTVYDRPDYTSVGGLLSYGSNRVETYRQAGLYIGRIIKGEKPADLPVQQATKLELIVNMKTAKALDLTVPPSLLLRAYEVIE
jgi:putative tryptophan/tyrosine transport system substrate-binding protein